ncbi:uncharacterized protein BX663DRAFT_450382 [Cokeromyces recurvatus]|uniref:uncharacterized protein n=1 Tax=Cokeromyces recurvatus TaxID=90255 RepID=UPI00221EBD5D|nr:uncharacterized protein BX663DRAFT_450382 [Cokeromyces recurvatus]KAI7904994.1 hypothetical protein BX663DRAFT_450382 [Cokeromyces recurvatus]
MTAETEQIFSNNFWGLKDEGFHILTAKMNSTKKTYDEIKSFYNIRASLHEEFGRKLMKHAKTGMGREESGTLRALLISAHQEMEWTAQAHLNLAQKLKTKLEVDLDNFILEQKDKRKLTQANVEKAHRYKQSSETYLAKAKEKYESDCAKLVTLQSQIGNVSGREAERIRQRIERTQHEIKIQEQEYKNACIKVSEATESWNKAWKMACDTYQLMEKKRLEFLHHSFAMYINVLSSATSQDQESYERFWKSLDQYDAVKDMQTFINEKGTGSKIPEPEIFVDYMDDPAKTFQQHTIANFPVPAELATTPMEGEKTKEKLISDHEQPSVPSKSASVRRKSILRNIAKPLPSISAPLLRQQKNSPLPPPPALVVPEISCESTTDSSDEEDNSKSTGKNQNQEKDDNITIDPRAKVVFAIGNNMFDLGHLDLDDKNLDNDKLSDNATKNNRMRSSGLLSRSTTTRRRQPSADLEAACNFSYQSLLEELGIYDNKDKKKNDDTKNNSQQKTKPITTTTAAATTTTTKLSKRRNTNIYPYSNSTSHPLNNNDPYIHARHQQQYYHPYTNTPHHYVSVNRINNYCPPINIPPSNKPILFWVLTLRDWFSGKPDELQFSKGTWLAVTEARVDGWYFAVKFNPRINHLTNEQGYVAQNMVQVYS